MNEYLRDRVLRKLETLSDERIYQVLDYVDFLESKYAQRQAPSSNVFTRFTEGVEDTLRAGRISASTVAETMGLLNKAMGVLSGVAAAGKSVANDMVSAASRAAERAAPAPPTPPPSAPPPPAPPSSTAPPSPPAASPPTAGTTSETGGAAA
ncbi:MAG TPA: hypothetical protein VJ672_09345 [Gemmatimonadaceae bacterium]|nr:hypothetical protein [Gemmatimonadaceae bacterium]